MIAIKKKAIKKQTIQNIEDIVSSSLFYWNLYEETREGNVALNKKYKTEDTHQLVHPVFKVNQQKTSPYYPAFLNLFQEIYFSTLWHSHSE